VKLVDVMSGSGLSMFAIVALVLFVGAFVTVVFLTFRPSTNALHARVARLPLDDDSPASAPRTED
jgi:cbb3-type cytochrome oxidase subunit 3